MSTVAVAAIVPGLGLLTRGITKSLQMIIDGPNDSALQPSQVPSSSQSLEQAARQYLHQLYHAEEDVRKGR